MFEELLQSFAGSDHHNELLGTLSQNGMSEADSNALLEHGLPAAAQAMHGATAGNASPADGLLGMLGGLGGGGGPSGGDLLTGALGGLLSGQGMEGAVENVATQLVLQQVAGALADKAGMDPAKAKAMATVAAPIITKFVHEKLAAAKG